MTKKIVFLGAPSTGKSTLCSALANHLHTNWVPEYGREYWLENQVERRLTPEQLLHIAETQNKWEEDYISHSKGLLMCDTNAFTTWHFALHYHQSALPKLTKLAEQSWQRYCLVVLCDNDIPYDDTWERSGDANRAEFQNFLINYLEQNKIKYTLATGAVAERVDIVLRAIDDIQT
jgi:NadR type nicotinamide-nucleotide adenylyltransferase